MNSLDPAQRAVARELVEWREGLAERGDRPVSSVLQDAPLVEIAKRRPQTSERLSQIRGLHESTLRRRGRDILDAVARGREREGIPVEGDRPSQPDAADAPLIALAEALVRARATSAGLAYELLATRADLQRIVTAVRAEGASAGARTCARSRAGGARSWARSCSTCSRGAARCAWARNSKSRSTGSLTCMLDEFEADISVRGEELWVLPRGDLDIAAATELEETLSLALASDAKAIVIDLRGLEFLDSTGLRTLVQAPMAEGGERISFVAGNDHVQSVFRISGPAGRADLPHVKLHLRYLPLACAPTSSASSSPS